MDREELGRRRRASFLGDAEDRIDALNADLLVLEKQDEGDRKAAVQRLFRSSHSLKGAARAVGIGSIETMCHRMEELLAGVRDGARALDPELTELFFATVDAVQAITARLQDGSGADDELCGSLIERLEAALVGASGEPSLPPLAPRPAPSNGASTSTRAPPTNGSATAANGKPKAVRAPEAAEPAEASGDGPSTLRVATERLENLLNESGELILAHRRVDRRVRTLAEITEQLRRVEGALRVEHAFDAEGSVEHRQRLTRSLESVVEELLRDERRLGRIAGRLNRTAQAVRMTSFSAACRGLARAARDVAASEGKLAQLHVLGGDVELDRLVVERLRDPLLHLVRNAVSHGIEAPEQRERSGKLAQGRVTLSASLRGDTVEITVEDDGRGIDHDVLRARAANLGMPVPEDDRLLEQLLFEAGFTTAMKATRFSGRGVGLDVVKAEIEGLHGSIDLTSGLGRGCRFALTVPLTLTAIHALLVRCAGRHFALPSATVTGLMRIRAEDVRDLPTGRALQHGNRFVPLRHLAPLLGVGDATPFPSEGRLPVAIVGNAGAEVALVVEALEAELEILVKDLGPRLHGLEFVSGATILESGQVALILNAAALARSLDGRGAVRRASIVEKAPVPATSAKRLLVADDSVTTRMLLMGVLEGAGYQVTAVPDGMAAWERLQRDAFDLLVSDVEMPRMDGFGLTERLRSSVQHRNMPVILVTGLEKEEQRLRGLAVGANAYLVKSGFESHCLLDAIEELI